MIAEDQPYAEKKPDHHCQLLRQQQAGKSYEGTTGVLLGLLFQHIGVYICGEDVTNLRCGQNKLERNNNPSPHLLMIRYMEGYEEWPAHRKAQVPPGRYSAAATGSHYIQLSFNTLDNLER